ncbi:MAG: preprotein translocase subunit SecE [Candidatus Magasanikbacteria bacterium RIFCSPHIGHO2_01_FULL_33_34]|uniref:Protein translocase subunit SecE n=1 Tax=Candidatus Magasanikbacteria bacterium RIFCSPHIGHO2_01_FULL_33_34 TaxID=1798671 RepID=A0A1F6LKD8_9BACT|nr:MAG: preprotein translocase subunit SecE [Candidatus Magasanikbacteria bacterium RIFCSPHIGHO2_01_FULL_33_34]OGH65645.1 MAG: preprotein translocase subunit SecE [Candidatus Magasanikbacteria bacterium RIFCSPHIGHO2_02_FULL_33_17]OGH75854.1 MAG: preprotein translocase subunit SecE [Candidatus Magasanikbacteria bacterium RIFCSPLOWO2_01_FULL_33_34]OGH81135.1 MAG: preprotein translocase subunit SecE [Candidatus Magasanikbacteria bacterium RIFCSPLOWO2_12_FULL_34_7]
MKLIKSLKDYFVGAYQEGKKIVWPNKKQVKTYTILVIAMSLGVAVFFAILDYVFNIGLGQLIK